MISKLNANNWAKLSNERQIQLRDSFVQLITDKATRRDGMALFHYLLVKDGGQFKNNSFISYVAPFVFKDLMDAGTQVRQQLALKRYDDAAAHSSIGMTWGDFMDKFTAAYGTHIDNKQYLKYIRQDVSDTGIHTPEQLEKLGFVVHGTKGKELIEFPETYRSGTGNVFKLETVYQPAGHLAGEGYKPTIQTGIRAIYKKVSTTGARNTFKAASAVFGTVPDSDKLLSTVAAPVQKTERHGYSPVQQIEVKQGSKPQTQQEVMQSETGVKRVISGGQTGVDMAGLDAALEVGIPTGGTAAAGYTQSIGPKSSDKISNKELATKYGLKEGQITRKQGQYGPYDDVYTQRTVANAQEADGTIWFGNADSPGGKLTLGTTAQKGKPAPLVNPKSVDEIRNWLAFNRIETLNIAGNREHTNPGIYQKSKDMLVEALGQSKSSAPVSTQTEATKQLLQKHDVVIAMENGKPVAYKGTERMAIPAGVTTPRELLDYLDNAISEQHFDEENKTLTRLTNYCKWL